MWSHYTFRRSYGISLARFIRGLQVQRAFSLLSDPASSISAVAAETGFSDQSHMTRTFVQTYGVTPSRLRKDGHRQQEWFHRVLANG